MDYGDVVRLKTGIGPRMVMAGPTCGGTLVFCLYFIEEHGQLWTLYRRDIPECCLELCEPKTN